MLGYVHLSSTLSVSICCRKTNSPTHNMTSQRWYCSLLDCYSLSQMSSSSEEFKPRHHQVRLQWTRLDGISGISRGGIPISLTSLTYAIIAIADGRECRTDENVILTNASISRTELLGRTNVFFMVGIWLLKILDLLSFKRLVDFAFRFNSIWTF